MRELTRSELGEISETDRAPTVARAPRPCRFLVHFRTDEAPVPLKNNSAKRAHLWRARVDRSDSRMPTRKSPPADRRHGRRRLGVEHEATQPAPDLVVEEALATTQLSHDGLI